MNYIPDGYREIKKRAAPVRTRCTCHECAPCTFCLYGAPEPMEGAIEKVCAGIDLSGLKAFASPASPKRKWRRSTQ